MAKKAIPQHLLAKLGLPSPFRVFRRQSGVALLIALFAMVLMTFIAVEVSYDTSVDYVVAAQQMNRVKAYYAAKAGIEISLLRIMLYKQAMAAVGDSLGPARSMLDPIWQFPFMWPPTAMGDKMTEVDKGMLASVVKESLMQGQYATTIVHEGGKVDINDLGSDVKSLREATAKQVLKIFQSQIQHDEDFARKYSGYRFEDLVKHMIDYMDADVESQVGGDESSFYRDIEDTEVQMPPNRPLRTVDELIMVAEMTDDFYNLLLPRITIFGTKGINVNYANRDMIMSLDSSISGEIADKILERRNDPQQGPFKDDEDFFGVLNQLGANAKAIQESKIPLLYDPEYNFRVISTGLSGNTKREITAISYDFDNLSQRLAEMLMKEETADGKGTPAATGASGGTGATGAGTGGAKPEDKKSKYKAPKGRPTVVYWEEN